MKVRDVIAALTALPMDEDLKVRFRVGDWAADLDVGEFRRENFNGSNIYCLCETAQDPIVTAEIKLEAP